MTEPGLGFHEAVRVFKRDLLARTLAAHKGNRTHAARALGLQRTYLLRLIREFDLKGRNLSVVDLPPCTNGHAAKPAVVPPVPIAPQATVVMAGERQATR